MKGFNVFLIGAVCFLIAGIAGSMIGDKGYFLLWLTNHRTMWLDYFFYYITKIGEWPGFVLFGILLWLSSWKRMLAIPILGIVVTLISFILKQSFKSERPTLYLEKIGWDGPLHVLDYHMVTGFTSFPSGHSMAAWALFTFLAAHYKKSWFSVVAVVLAFSVSLSRVYLMVHFLRDVVVGAMIGIALGYATYYYFRKWVGLDNFSGSQSTMKQESMASND
jgi:membrane-associated phospholipid phosphatase